MSDNPRYAVVIGEGIHDVAAVVRVLRLKGFSEIEQYHRIPPLLAQGTIPNRYPLPDASDRLTRSVPHPSFLERDGCYLHVSNANGETRIGKNMFGLLNTPRIEVLEQLQSLTIIMDADCDTVEEKQRKLLSQISVCFENCRDFDFSGFASGIIQVYGRGVPVFFYVIPDHQSSGTLEALLLEGAQRSYPALLAGSTAYVDSAKECYASRLKNYNADKAKVGAVANILRPGRPNQASIFSDDWFTAEGLVELPLQAKFSRFLDLVIATL